MNACSCLTPILACIIYWRAREISQLAAAPDFPVRPRRPLRPPSEARGGPARAGMDRCSPRVRSHLVSALVAALDLGRRVRKRVSVPPSAALPGWIGAAGDDVVFPSNLPEIVRVRFFSEGEAGPGGAANDRIASMTWADRLIILAGAGAIAATVGAGTCSTNARFGEVRTDMRELRTDMREVRDEVRACGTTCRTWATASPRCPSRPGGVAGSAGPWGMTRDAAPRLGPSPRRSGESEGRTRGSTSTSDRSTATQTSTASWRSYLGPDPTPTRKRPGRAREPWKESSPVVATAGPSGQPPLTCTKRCVPTRERKSNGESPR